MISDINAIAFEDVFTIPHHGPSNCITFELKHNVDFNAIIRICANHGIDPKDYNTLEKIKIGVDRKIIYHIEIKTYISNGVFALKVDDTYYTKAYPDKNSFNVIDLIYAEILRKNQHHNLDKKISRTNNHMVLAK